MNGLTGKNKCKTCKDCKWYDASDCWCDLHGVDKDFLGEPCERFRLKEVQSDDGEKD